MKFVLFETGSAKWIELDGKRNRFHSTKSNATKIEALPFEEWDNFLSKNNLTYLSSTIIFEPVSD